VYLLLLNLLVMVAIPVLAGEPEGESHVTGFAGGIMCGLSCLSALVIILVCTFLFWSKGSDEGAILAGIFSLSYPYAIISLGYSVYITSLSAVFPVAILVMSSYTFWMNTHLMAGHPPFGPPPPPSQGPPEMRLYK
jgi:hypothetical protein